MENWTAGLVEDFFQYLVGKRVIEFKSRVNVHELMKDFQVQQSLPKYSMVTEGNRDSLGEGESCLNCIHFITCKKVYLLDETKNQCLFKPVKYFRNPHIEQYYLISLLNTHKDDAYITLKSIDNGLGWFTDSIKKHELCETEKIHKGFVAVECKKIENLFRETSYGGSIRLFLPNTPTVLKQIGITSKDFKKKYRSSCPHKTVLT